MSQSISSEDNSDSDDTIPWIEMFCRKRKNRFFCQIDESYIDDSFNLYGLNAAVPNYAYALDIIMDYEISETVDLDSLAPSTELLYGMIHSRYILTPQGQDAIISKCQSGDYGQCPRVLCNSQNLLPIGLSDSPGKRHVRVYCPCCNDIYKPDPYSDLDGAYFGTTMCNLLIMQHPEAFPKREPQVYSPALYGYKIHSSSPYFQYHVAVSEDHRAPQLERQPSAFQTMRSSIK